MKKFLLLVLLAPTWALAQENPDPGGVVDNLPQSSAFWTVFLTAVALPFLGKALSLLMDMVINWRRAKGDKRAETYARLWTLAGDAVAYVNAKTKATREYIMSPGSEGGTRVTAAEAKAYQDEARMAMMEWLGKEGIVAAMNELGIAADKAEEWLRGLIQKRFETQRALDAASGLPSAVP